MYHQPSLRLLPDDRDQYHQHNGNHDLAGYGAQYEPGLEGDEGPRWGIGDELEQVEQEARGGIAQRVGQLVEGITQ